MQVTMTMEEYNKLKSLEEENKRMEIKNRLSDQGWRLCENRLKAIAQFFIDNNVTCAETIAQTDRIQEKLESFAIMVYELVEDRVVEECKTCGCKNPLNSGICGCCGECL